MDAEPHVPPQTVRDLPSIPPAPLILRCSHSIPNHGKRPSSPPHSSAAGDGRLSAAGPRPARCCPVCTSPTSSPHATRHSSQASGSPTSCRSSNTRQRFRRRSRFGHCTFPCPTARTKTSSRISRSPLRSSAMRSRRALIRVSWSVAPVALCACPFFSIDPFFFHSFRFTASWALAEARPLYAHISSQR